MSDIQAQPGELRATIHVKRAATGLTETYELVGHSDPEKLAEIIGTARHNRVHGASGAIVGPGSDLTTNQAKD